MSTSTDRRASAGAAPPPTSGTRSSRQRPAHLSVAVLGAAAAVSAVLMLTVAGPGPVRFVVMTVLLYLIGIYAASRTLEGPRKATDRLVTGLVATAFALALVPLVSVVWTVVDNGLDAFDWGYLTTSMRGVIGEGGGAFHAIVGTLVITAITALISIPIGLLAAIYLVEYGQGRLRKAITFLVDVMTGIPSIVAGLFAYALFVLLFGPGVRMGLAGAVALSVLMVPVVIRSGEEMLKLVPNELREASFALGVPKWRTIVKVVLPTAAAGIATGVTIAIARVIGETAPLLIVAGLTSTTNWNPFDERMATLPVYVYYSFTQPGIPPEVSQARAWAGALVLILIVMGLNLLARGISRLFSPTPGRRA